MNGEPALALLPGFDLLNHHHSAGQSELRSCGDMEAFVLGAGRAFEQGRQVFINCTCSGGCEVFVYVGVHSAC
jgi:hypothetical protein